MDRKDILFWAIIAILLTGGVLINIRENTEIKSLKENVEYHERLSDSLATAFVNCSEQLEDLDPYWYQK